jgi:hypothetical protein
VVAISESVDVRTDVETLWGVVTDWARQGDWIPATRVRVAQGDGRAVGDRVVARTAVGRLGFDDPMEIVRWEPSRVCEVRHLGRVVRGTGTFTVMSLGDGKARFVWTEDLTLPLGRAGIALLTVTRPLSRLLLRLALRRLVATM